MHPYFKRIKRYVQKPIGESFSLFHWEKSVNVFRKFVFIPMWSFCLLYQVLHFFSKNLKWPSQYQQWIMYTFMFIFMSLSLSTLLKDLRYMACRRLLTMQYFWRYSVGDMFSSRKTSMGISKRQAWRERARRPCCHGCFLCNKETSRQQLTCRMVQMQDRNVVH